MACTTHIGDGGEADSRVIYLTSQGHRGLGIEVIGEIDRMARGVHQLYLFSVLLDRGHLDLIAKTVGQRECGLDVPGIGDVHVIEIDRAFIGELLMLMLAQAR